MIIEYGILFFLVIASGLLAFGLGSLLQELLRRAAGQSRESVQTRLADLFIFVPAERLWPLKYLLLVVGAGASLFLVTTASWFVVLALAMIGGALGFYLPDLTLLWLWRYRRRRFSAQMLEALFLLASGLRAGFSFQQTLELLVQEMRPPLGQELALVLREYRLGVDLDVALMKCAQRMNDADFYLIVGAVSITRQSGGNLAQIFDRIETLVRERLLLKGKMAALTAQSRLQGVIVGVLPYLFAFLMYQINPQLVRLLWSTPEGILAVLAVVVLDIAGFFWVRKLAALRF